MHANATIIFVELGLLLIEPHKNVFFLQLYLIEDYGKTLKKVEENVYFYQW